MFTMIISSTLTTKFRMRFGPFFDKSNLFSAGSFFYFFILFSTTSLVTLRLTSIHCTLRLWILVEFEWGGCK